MYLFEQLQKIIRSEEKPEPVRHYLMDTVEIDNPVHDCKIEVPCFVEVPEKVPDFVNMKASAFGLQTMFEAGVQLRPSTIVNGSYLRDVENFMQNVTSKKF